MAKCNQCLRDLPSATTTIPTGYCSHKCAGDAVVMYRKTCIKDLQSQLQDKAITVRELEKRIEGMSDNELFTDCFIASSRAEIAAELIYDPERREYYMSELTYAEKFKKWETNKAKEK